ncbi:MAG: GNAT family N-acetyltransferase [Clostridium tyrobutyricum]|jgi:phosphinothricin acetyltransferase|uniref:GNAT family N-acetyltransferase n=1 Tax=Clostridium tyrobutyricum TaxID=1519 RepID=UPI00073D9C8B|nr:GNAT family N-acetyltransferase [Clostridium tyrobutyricum]MBV4440631.1 GNAT family N-acetyltransferase [Clostridium tyrobutyricum]MCH4200952.1 GNAT family N-acetyltransferase [Clostridium tyrobutyricum]MCH4238097.1 GNAT family N-acetyltransferase [Clostridium tyrobutyricum]MCH4259002.1 GNAT family N-acetyltransferase [Clostridium tyrobutyricum]MCI1239854.1 GNAT family N-acetyltransferase [Clostridium tyrobutyricum]
MQIKYFLKEGKIMTNITIRMATEADAKEILDIYVPYVNNTAISFEYDVPSVEEFTDRIINISKQYPYIVAIDSNRIIGYAYASSFNKRVAYDWAVETTIYLRQNCRGKGIGRKLYLALEEILKRQNILNLNACIAYTSTENAYLTNTSMYFHEHLGYKKIGHFTKCGYKFGSWYDMIWMEKIIGEHSETPKSVIPISEWHELQL